MIESLQHKLVKVSSLDWTFFLSCSMGHASLCCTLQQPLLLHSMAKMHGRQHAIEANSVSDAHATPAVVIDMACLEHCCASPVSSSDVCQRMLTSQ